MWLGGGMGVQLSFPGYGTAIYRAMLANHQPDVPTGREWAYEIKHDGFRSLAVQQGKYVRI